MAEKKLNVRIINKHGTEADWAKSTFIPKLGETVVFDADETHTEPRMKVGDGKTGVNDLPFITDSINQFSYQDLGEIVD